MKKLDNNNHSVFLLTYHLIICVKYRRKAIDEQIATRIKEIGEYVGKNYRITFLEYNHDRDHIHILFKAHPNTEISKYINAFKSASSRLVIICYLHSIWFSKVRLQNVCKPIYLQKT